MKFTYLPILGVAALMCLAPSAFADAIISYSVNDNIYGTHSGSTAPGATGSADTLNFNAAVFDDSETIDFVNASNIITDILVGGDRFTFYGADSGNAAIGTACDAAGSTSCVLATGSAQDITADLGRICCGSSDVQVTLGDALPSDPVAPEPSSIVLLLTGMAGSVGVARRRLFAGASRG